MMTPSMQKCHSWQLPCKNGQCIPYYHFCNGYYDCYDWSDEDWHYCSSRSGLFAFYLLFPSLNHFNNYDIVTTYNIYRRTSQDEKTNLHQICLVQICCKYEICKALQPVQRWQSPNLHKNGQIRRLPPLHWLQSFANFIFATYLHKANLMQIRFVVQCLTKYISRFFRFFIPVKHALKQINQVETDFFLTTSRKYEVKLLNNFLCANRLSAGQQRVFLLAS